MELEHQARQASQSVRNLLYASLSHHLPNPVFTRENKALFASSAHWLVELSIDGLSKLY